MSSPSDAPVRPPGSHTRSGNAMARTRAAILDAAATVVTSHGVRRTTMSDVAATGRVAKATLYNHFRTKDDLLDALVLAQLDQLAARCSEVAASGPAAVLELAALQLAASPVLGRARQDEPAVVAALAVPRSGRLWTAARGAVRSVLGAAGVAPDDAVVDLVLRWLVAQAVWPGSRAEVALGARVLAEGIAELSLRDSMATQS